MLALRTFRFRDEGFNELLELELKNCWNVGGWAELPQPDTLNPKTSNP